MLTTTYFSFRGEIYFQCFGIAMGSPVSPLVANFFMEWLEGEVNTKATSDIKPRMWKRYVGDVLAIISVGKSDELNLYLNSIDQTGNIKCTCEQPSNNSIAFLDTLITRESNGHITTTVYRKATHTNQYLNYTSHHPLQHKLSVPRTLLHRCDTIVSNKKDQKTEIQNIKTALTTCVVTLTGQSTK